MRKIIEKHNRLVPGALIITVIYLAYQISRVLIQSLAK